MTVFEKPGGEKEEGLDFKKTQDSLPSDFTVISLRPFFFCWDLKVSQKLMALKGINHFYKIKENVFQK